MSSKCCICESNYQCITLWDGKEYCEYCVSTVAPDLYQYAKDFPTFQDDMPMDGEDIRRRWLRSFIIVNLLFGTVSLCNVGLHPFQLIFIPSVIAFSYFYLRFWYYTHFNRRTSIRFANGEVFLSKGGKPFQLTCKLSEISWRIAPAASTNEFTKLLPKHDVVLISYPYQMPSPLESITTRREVPCGWAYDKMQILIGFLTLANVPKTPSRSLSNILAATYSSLTNRTTSDQK